MTNVIKKLDNEKKDRLQGQESIVKETKLLLSNNAIEETKVLNRIGLTTHLREIEKSNERSLLNFKYTEEFAETGKVFHVSDIKKVCVRYRLFFKLAKFYRGAIPPDLAADLVRFSDMHNKTSSSERNFFIMAPPKMFSDYLTLGQKVAKVHTDVWDSTYNAWQGFLASMSDPVIFYRIDEEHFLMIRKWGHDFSFFRRILGKVTAKKSTFNTALFLFPIVNAVLTVMGAVSLCSFISRSSHASDGMSGYGFTLWMLTILVALGYGILAWVYSWYALFGGYGSHGYKAENFATETRFDSEIQKTH